MTNGLTKMKKKDKKAEEECGPLDLRCSQTCSLGGFWMEVDQDGDARISGERYVGPRRMTRIEMEWIIKMYPRMWHAVQARMGKTNE